MLGALLTIALLAACGQQSEKEESKASSTDSTKPLSVDLQVPEKGEKNKTLQLKTIVKHKGKPVDDASDVQYEVWQDGAKETSQMIQTKHEKGGIYTADHSFENNGKYTVQVHVTAHDLHTMPTSLITIGDVTIEKDASNNEGHHHGNDQAHKQAEDFSMHFMKSDQVKKNQETNLTVHLEKNAKPLEKAQVRYEIWKAEDEKHAWVDAKEGKPGEYASRFNFPKAGDYTVKVHVENDKGLHEHEENKLTVK